LISPSTYFDYIHNAVSDHTYLFLPTNILEPNNYQEHSTQFVTTNQSATITKHYLVFCDCACANLTFIVNDECGIDSIGKWAFARLDV